MVQDLEFGFDTWAWNVTDDMRAKPLLVGCDLGTNQAEASGHVMIQVQEGDMNEARSHPDERDI